MEEVLLPTHTVPRAYDIHLTPDLKACTFSGCETITVDVVRATRSIELHAHQLAVAEASFTPPGVGAKSITPARLTLDLLKQRLILEFSEELPVGAGAALKLSFHGTLNDELAGLYRAKYFIRGEQRWAAVTQFEACDARRAFPCWDEPAVKATFALHITAPADRVVRSNMHAERVDTSADGTTKTHHFAPTPVMSSYLVALIVGEWDSITAYGKVCKVPTTILTPVGKADLGRFALRAGTAALDFLQEMFALPYMGTKVDHVAITDFSAGAMENTGLITYREAALLVDEAASSLATKKRVFEVVAHELAHQWFGNLVSPQWWKQLWLNEGFAAWCQNQVTHALNPEWHMWATFVASSQASAFSLDAMASTHPIEVELHNPDEISEVFDRISYEKGASTIRMVVEHIGMDAFTTGMRAYFARHAFGNTVTEDLWAALGEASGQPLTDIMRNWTKTSGHPYLLVQRNPSGGLTLDSRRFIAAWARNAEAWPAADDFADGPGPAPARAAVAKWAVPPTSEVDANEDWCIPLSAVVSGAGKVKLGVALLDSTASGSAGREAELEKAAAALSGAMEGASWVKLNADHSAFHRTVYDEGLLELLDAAVITPEGGGEPALGTADRLGLVGDVAAAVSVGLTRASTLLLLLSAFRYERNYAVWVAVLDAVSDLRTTAEAVSEAAAEKVDAYTRALLAHIVAHTGWEARAGEDANAPLLRSLVLRVAAVAGHPETTEEALKRFAERDRVSIASDLKQLVYNTAASHGGAAQWEALLSMLRAADSSEEQRRCITALGRSRDPALLSRALDLVLADGSPVRSQDWPFLIGSVASNHGPVGRTLAWGWLRSHWDTLRTRLGAGNFLWGSIVGSATKYFDSRAAADEIAAFFREHPAGSAERTVKQSLEAVRSRVWRAHILKAEGVFA